MAIVPSDVYWAVDLKINNLIYICPQNMEVSNELSAIINYPFKTVDNLSVRFWDSKLSTVSYLFKMPKSEVKDVYKTVNFRDCLIQYEGIVKVRLASIVANKELRIKDIPQINKLWLFDILSEIKDKKKRVFEDVSIADNIISTFGNLVKCHYWILIFNPAYPKEVALYKKALSEYLFTFMDKTGYYDFSKIEGKFCCFQLPEGETITQGALWEGCESLFVTCMIDKTTLKPRVMATPGELANYLRGYNVN